MQIPSRPRRHFKLHNYKITKLQNSSRGYILITLMLFMTLLTMAALAVLPDIVQQIKRDREEEMVHRGTEYMRAIKKYYKKFGRYPSRVEELENTNQMRFLRKRYKDPMVKGEKDFKFVRQGDPALNMLGMGGVGRGLTPGAGGGLNPGLGAALTQSNNPTFVGATGGGIRQATSDDGNTPPATGLPGQQPPDKASAGADSDNPDQKSADSSSDSSSSSGPGGQAFGGGPILGVASTSKEKTIREYNKKSHYNEWLFIYDPSSDRGGLLKGPIQPDANRNAGINPAGTQPTIISNQPPPVQQPGQQVIGQQPPADDQ